MFTQCPECKTVFRVTPEQLGAAGGKVRCSRCRTVFNAIEHPFEPPQEAATEPPAAESSPDTETKIPPSRREKTGAQDEMPLEAEENTSGEKLQHAPPDNAGSEQPELTPPEQPLAELVETSPGSGESGESTADTEAQLSDEGSSTITDDLDELLSELPAQTQLEAEADDADQLTAQTETADHADLDALLEEISAGEEPSRQGTPDPAPEALSGEGAINDLDAVSEPPDVTESDSREELTEETASEPQFDARAEGTTAETTNSEQSEDEFSTSDFFEPEEAEVTEDEPTAEPTEETQGQLTDQPEATGVSSTEAERNADASQQEHVEGDHGDETPARPLDEAELEESGPWDDSTPPAEESDSALFNEAAGEENAAWEEAHAPDVEATLDAVTIDSPPEEVAAHAAVSDEAASPPSSSETGVEDTVAEAQAQSAGDELNLEADTEKRTSEAAPPTPEVEDEEAMDTIPSEEPGESARIDSEETVTEPLVESAGEWPEGDAADGLQAEAELEAAQQSDTAAEQAASSAGGEEHESSEPAAEQQGDDIPASEEPPEQPESDIDKLDDELLGLFDEQAEAGAETSSETPQQSASEETGEEKPAKGGGNDWDPFSEENIEALLTPSGDEESETVDAEETTAERGMELPPEELDLAGDSVDGDEELLNQTLPEEEEYHELELDELEPSATGDPTTAAATPESSGESSDENAQESYSLHPQMEPQKPRNAAGMLVWGTGILLLFATLGLQYLYYHRTVLAENPSLRPLLSQMCQLTGCQLPPRRDLGSIKLADHLMQFHPRYQDSLLITATLVNRADFPQPYPLVEVAMTDLQQKVIARRRFTPEEYLVGEPSANGFNPNTEVPLMLEVLDPGQQAVGFEFNFY